MSKKPKLIIYKNSSTMVKLSHFPLCLLFYFFFFIKTEAGNDQLSSNDSPDDYYIMNGKYYKQSEIFNNFHPVNEIREEISHDESTISKSPTLISNDPHENSDLYAGGVYVQHELKYQPIIHDSTQFDRTSTPEALVRELYEHPTVTPRVISIIGTTQIGKTATLARIEYEINKLWPTVWTIRVELPRIFPSTRFIEDMTLEMIIQQHVNEPVRHIFNKLLENNPKKVVFLLDGINEMTNERETKITAIIKDLMMKKVTLVITGDTNTMNLLHELQISNENWLLSEMKFYERQNFLRNIWKVRINERLSASPNSLPASAIDKRLDDYVSTISFLLRTTPLTFQPTALMSLAKYFEETKSLINVGQRNVNGVVGCLDYVFDSQFSTPMSLLAMKYTVLLNKNTLYDSITAAITRHHNDIPQATIVYGSVALNQIVFGIEVPTVATQLLKHTIGNFKISLLMHKPQPPFIKFMTKDVIEFIHPDFQNYFAAQLVIKLMKPPVDSTTPVDLIRRILTYFEYNYLLEFINCQAQLIQPMFIREVLLADENLNIAMLDNLIKNGFEDIYLQIHGEIRRHPHLLTQLHDYFHDLTQTQYLSKRSFGLLQLPQLRANRDDILEPPTISPYRRRLDYIIDNNMLRTCEVLHDSGIKFSSNHIDYNELLHSIVTKPIPNVDLFEFCMRYMVPPTCPIAFDDLFYATISEVGEVAIPMAKCLIRFGANPATMNYNSGTLLHAAVKWNSIKLLHYIMNDLGIKNMNTFDNYGRSVFSAALDANPWPFHTASGFWESMLYLMANGEELRPINQLSIGEFEALHISNSDLSSDGLRIMLCGTPQNLITSSSEHIRQLTVQPIIKNEPLDLLFTTLSRITLPALWHLQPETQSLRRNLIRHKLWYTMEISPLEMLINYRGLERLHDADRIHYRETIKLLLEREKGTLTRVVTSRIINSLINHIGDVRDLEDLEYFLINGLMTNVNDELLVLLKKKLLALNVKSETLKQTSSRGVSIYDRLLLSRVNYSPVMSNIDEFNHITNRIVESIDQKITGCLSRLSRRNIISSNCHITWTDVDHYNDAIKNRRSINEVRVNSDKLLQQLAINELNDKIKAQQTIEFLRILQSQHPSMKFITGNSKTLMSNVLQHGSIINYRQYQRLTSTINDVWQQTTRSGLLSQLKFPLPSRSVAIFAAAAIPIIRGIYGTVSLCQEKNQNHSGCLFASSALALSVALPPIGFATIKYTPWIIDRFSRTALDMLPSSTSSQILRNNLMIMRNIGMKYGAYTVAGGLALVGIGFDLYNIVEMSRMIDMCNNHQESYQCLSKDKIDYIISLSFSCVSIVVTAGLIIGGIGLLGSVLVGLAMMTIQMIAMGLNEIIYYSNKYHTNFDENFRIFFHKVAFQPTPQDVQALARRTDWIKITQERINDLLDSNENIVAYAVGLGVCTETNIKASKSIIDMKYSSVDNSKGLSRVLPTAKKNTILLCLPKRNWLEKYDNYENTMPNAVYHCDNSFVIAHEERWNDTKHGKTSIIIYDLEYVNIGDIYANNDYNNVFLINKSTKRLKIIGGSGDKTDSYIIRTDLFRGQIVLIGNLMKNILDMSMIPHTASLAYHWNNQLRLGSVQLSNTSQHDFSVAVFYKEFVKLHIIGRARISDFFRCNSAKNWPHFEMHMSIDGKGGESRFNMDRIIDCAISIVRPYTNIIGSLHTNATYTAYVWLEVSYKADFLNEVYATIQPRQSKFIVTFANRPILLSTLSVKYSYENDTLLWHFDYNTESSLLLSIEQYRSPSSQLIDQNNETIDLSPKTVNCIFIDGYHGLTIHPVITPINNATHTAILRQFNVFVAVNVSRATDIYQRYNYINTFYNKMYEIVTKIIHSSTNRTFIFGSAADERFYIDGNTVFLFGDDGSDVYVLSSDSPKFVWIDNEAFDSAMDTLVLPDTACESLRAKKGSENFDFCDGWKFDVTLECLNGEMVNKNIILRNYLLATHNQHLQIIWNNAKYILLQNIWRRENTTNESDNETIHFVLLFSFDDEWQSTILTLTSNDSHLMLNMTETNNPLVAYKTDLNDVTLTRKYLNRRTSSFVVLKDFLTNGFLEDISIEWLDFKIFVLDNSQNNGIPIILTIDDIKKLLRNSETEKTIENQTSLIKEYLVNLNEPGESIIIEHNNNTLEKGNYQLGILVIIGARLGQLRAQWNDTSLLLIVEGKHKKFKIYVKNWCIDYRYRLHRIEFVSSLQQQPFVIGNVDEIECDNANDDKLLSKFNKKLQHGQQDTDEDNDQSRLIKCIESILTNILADNNPMYKLFGFMSEFEQVIFMRENCNTLFTRENFETLSLETINESWKNRINIFQVTSEAIEEEWQSIVLFSRRLKQLDNHCWHNMTTFLYNNDVDDINSVQMLNNVTSLLSQCIPDL